MNGDGFRDYVERVRAASDIAQVLKEHVELGPSNQAKCPFHEDHTPSLSVNPKGQYFHCFGCGTGGDVFRLLERIEGIPFIDALERLAARAGLPAWAYTPEMRLDLERDRSRREILAAATYYYHGRLTDEARAYLTFERGIPDELIARFQIGWADGGLRQHLLDSGFDEAACIEAGVLKERDGRVLDFLYHRIVFPVLWHGQATQLTGRRLDGGEPKYLHLPGPIEHFYNEDVIDESAVFVVEGPMDALSLEAWGKPAVALLGATSRLDAAADKLSGTERVYVCLDADAAGERGTAGLAERLGTRCRVVGLPAGRDVNDLLSAGEREMFESLVNEAKDAVTLRIEQVPVDTPKLELVDALGPILGLLAGVDVPRQEAYLDLLKTRFNLRREEVEGYRKLVRERRRAIGAASDEDDHREAPVVLTTYFGGLVDLVEAEGRSAFLVQGQPGPEVQFSVHLDGIEHIPPRKEEIPWLLPRADEVIRWRGEDTNRQLFLDLVDYHRSVSELPSDAHYTLLAAWDFHTYLLEHAQYSPYLWFHGVPERGKSRTGKGLSHVAYRGLHVESLREAYLFRAAQDLHATIFFDVMDLWKKAERSQSEDILLMRFERGARVPRVLYPDRGPLKDTVYYEIFGASVLGTNEPIHHIMETRALLISLPETSRAFDGDVTEAEARCYRERLVAFRSRHVDSGLPKTDKPCRGRLGDISRPLLQILRLVCPDQEPVLLGLLRDIEIARQLQKTESLEAQIVAAVRFLGGEVAGGILPVKRITDVVNEPRGDREKVSAQKVGRRLTALGFRKARTVNNSSAIQWNEEFLSRVELAYALHKTPETPETPGPLSDNDFPAGVSPEFRQNTGANTGVLSDWEPTTSGVSGVSGDSPPPPGNHHPHTPATLDEAFEERAAIAEYDGGLTRKEAEALAASATDPQPERENDNDGQ